MTRYRTTAVAYDATAGRNVDKIYTVVERAGAAGATWVDLAATAGVVQTGIHSYLYTLRKAGVIESFEAATPKEAAAAAEEQAVEDVFTTRKPPKWRCPTCRSWTSGPIGRRCIVCKGESNVQGAPDGRGVEEPIQPPQPAHAEKASGPAPAGSARIPSAASRYVERLLRRG